MPRTLDPDLLAAMNGGNFMPFFNVQLMDVDKSTILAQTTEILEFALNGLEAKVVFYDPDYTVDYSMFRIQRGVMVEGAPHISINSSCYWPYFDRHNNHIRTLYGHVFPANYFSTPGDVTYSSIISTICAAQGFDVVHADPAADWLTYKVCPSYKYYVTSRITSFFSLLRQKYLIFATDYDDDTLYFYQAKLTGPSFPSGYTLIESNKVYVPGQGSYQERTFYSKDELNVLHTSGGTNKPTHNLGYLESTATHPAKYYYTDTPNWIVLNIRPNLKYLDFDAVYAVTEFGNLQIWPAKFIEIYNPNFDPPWQWQTRYLDIFGNTEGGPIPFARPFPLPPPFPRTRHIDPPDTVEPPPIYIW